MLLSALVAPNASAGESKPLWEFGFGLAPATFPDYRGSSEQQAYLLPLPYVVYRGDFLRADREGIRGRLIRGQAFEVDLSFDGAVPVSSDDDNARAGMDDLDPVFEFGPSINWVVHEGDGFRWQLRLPVRAGIATDFSRVEQVGWRFQPMLNLDLRDVMGGWNVGVNLGPQFATRDYHAYYYDVAADETTDDRPAYRAPAGYGGTGLLLSASRRFDNLWVGGFMRYENLNGARYEDSPLVETRHSVMGAIGVAWVFGQSQERVQIGQD